MSAGLNGKIAVVTGGSRGIGRAIVARFDHEGAVVITCGRGERPHDLKAGVVWRQVDVGSGPDVLAFKEYVARQYGGLDVLVNNAGVQLEKNIVASTDEDWDQVTGVNIKGVFLCCRAFIPLMTSRGGGVIINIGSTAGHQAEPGMAIYNGSKAFVHGITRSIAVDHGADGIRCNAICPGWIMTAMAETAFDLADNPDAAKADALVRHPLGRLGQPEDIAAAAVWLASRDAVFITGQTITVDGGLVAGSPLQPALF